MVLYVLRGAFIILVASVTMLYVLPFQQDQEISFTTVVLMLAIALSVSAAVVATDMASKQKNMSAGSGIFLGLLAGLLAAYAMSFVVDLIGLVAAPTEVKLQAGPIFNLLQGVKVFIGLVTCYIGISMVIQTKDDFRFVVPYVEFSREIRGNRTILLDTSVIIDGRILDLTQTKLIQGSLLVPKFVLNELQQVADSNDRLRRARGRRGLDILQKLQEHPTADVSITDLEAEGANVDQKLVALAKTIDARVMTNDFNLNKIATLRGVDVINLNDVAKAMRPVVLPGEAMRVMVVKPGEGPTQGVGYLEDGTMVVVEGARSQLGHEIELTVTSMLQTSAGRMIFGRIVVEEPVRTASSINGPRKSQPPMSHPAGPSATHGGDPDGNDPTNSHTNAGEHFSSSASTTSPEMHDTARPATPNGPGVTPNPSIGGDGPNHPTGDSPDDGNNPSRPRPQSGFYPRNPRRGH